MAVPPVHLMKDGDEHGRDILQEILRLCGIKKRGVLTQLVRDLIDDEGTAIRECFVRFLQQGAFFLDFEYAERDSGKDVVAVRNTTAPQFLWQIRGIAMDNMNPRIARELALEVAGKSRVQLEEEQLRSRGHPPGDLP